MNSVGTSSRVRIISRTTEKFTESKLRDSLEEFTDKMNKRAISNNYCQKNKPLVIFLPFLGASRSVISKYVDLYQNYGCRVIIHKSKLTDFVWPVTGLKNSYEFLANIENNIKEEENVVVHSMSIGCYFYSLMLMNINAHPQHFQTFVNNMRGQIIESPVAGSLKEMATALASSVYKEQLIRRNMLQMASMLYFALTKPFTVKYYNEALDSFYNKPLKVASIMYTTENDPMAIPAEFDKLVENWKQAGVEVSDKVWTESKHAGILKTYPREYQESIYNFLDRVLKLNPKFTSKL